MAIPHKRAIFRADASPQIGGGHIMRCLTLAEQLSAANWMIGFACTNDTLTIIPRLRNRVEILEAPNSDSLDANALSQRWPSGCDVLVVDHYSLGSAFETSCRGWAQHVVAIDDLADRPHDCDLLIDSTLGRQAQDYASLVPICTLILTGADYALLRPEFAGHRHQSLARRATQEVGRVLVSLGLTDMGGITKPIVGALLDLDLKISIDVILGPVAPSRYALEKLSKLKPCLCIHIDPPNIAELMTEADIAIGAGGTTSWERCCLGLPTLLLVLADNQELIADKLESAGAAVCLGKYTKLTPTLIGQELIQLISRPDRVHNMSSRAAQICDGQGTIRVMKQLGFI